MNSRSSKAKDRSEFLIKALPVKDGEFTGVFFGMYATGNGKQSNVPAAFDCFEYKTAD